MSPGEALESLFNVWNLIAERRFKTYGHAGIIVLNRGEDSVVQEKYYPTLELFSKEYNTAPRSKNSLVIDLSEKE